MFTESSALTQDWRKATCASLLAVFWKLTCWEALLTTNKLPNAFEMENFWLKWASGSFQLLATVWQNNFNVGNCFAEAAYLTIRTTLNIYLKLVGFKYWRALLFPPLCLIKTGWRQPGIPFTHVMNAEGRSFQGLKGLCREGKEFGNA